MESSHIVLIVFAGCGALVFSVGMVLSHFRRVAEWRHGRAEVGEGELAALRGEVAELKETVGSLVWVLEDERRRSLSGGVVGRGSETAGQVLAERVGEPGPLDRVD